MIGMNAETGRGTDGIDHLYQSINKILTTPVGSRVERRDFGSELPELVDAPNNPANRVRLFSAIATALMRWEPRLSLTRVTLQAPGIDGTQMIDIEGVTTETGDKVSAAFNIGQQQ
jgi:phage baseplate assembly protein W